MCVCACVLCACVVYVDFFPCVLLLSNSGYACRLNDASSSSHVPLCLCAVAAPKESNFVQIVRARPALQPVVYNPPPPPFDPYTILSRFIYFVLLLLFIGFTCFATMYIILAVVYKISPGGSTGVFLGETGSVVVTNTGAMGVGTSNPKGALEVSSTAVDSGTILRISSKASSAPRVCACCSFFVGR